MSGDTKRVLEVNQIDNLQGSTQRVKQETTLNNLRGITQRVYVVGGGGEPINNQDKTITANGSYTADEGYTGLGTVTVNVPNPSTGTMYIISNGTYNVADKAIANVNVPTTAPELYRVFRVNKGKIENSISTPFMPLPSTATDIGDYVYANAYLGTPSSVLSGSIDLSSLTKISGQYACQSMFFHCTGITSVDLSGLTSIEGQAACQAMFRECSGITSVNLSSLVSIYKANASYNAAQMFYQCTNLTSIDLSALEEIKNNNACENMFYGCTNLASVNLSKLKTITGMYACRMMFRDCTMLTSLSFPALTSSSFGSWTNQFYNMLQGITGCTVHFPSNLQSVIGSWTDVVNGFGGTNTTVSFDLPATE